MLNNKNIKINRSSKFLNYKNLNLYKIIKVINNITLKLKLSKKIKKKKKFIYNYCTLMIIIHYQIK